MDSKSKSPNIHLCFCFILTSPKSSLLYSWAVLVFLVLTLFQNTKKCQILKKKYFLLIYKVPFFNLCFSSKLFNCVNYRKKIKLKCSEIFSYTLLLIWFIFQDHKSCDLDLTFFICDSNYNTYFMGYGNLLIARPCNIYICSMLATLIFVLPLRLLVLYENTFMYPLASHMLYDHLGPSSHLLMPVLRH